MNKDSSRRMMRGAAVLLLSFWLGLAGAGCSKKKKEVVNANPLWAAREAWAHENLQKIAEKQWPDIGESLWPIRAFVHESSYWAVDSNPQPYSLDWDLVRFVFHAPVDPRQNKLVGIFSREPHGWEEILIDDEHPEFWIDKFTLQDSYGLGAPDGN